MKRARQETLKALLRARIGVPKAIVFVEGSRRVFYPVTEPIIVTLPVHRIEAEA